MRGWLRVGKKGEGYHGWGKEGRDRGGLRVGNEGMVKGGEKGSCNNVAPVSNLCLGRATTRSHSSQWSKKKVAVET